MAKPTMTAAEKARRALDKHPDWDNKRIAKSATGATHAIINALRAGADWRTILDPGPTSDVYAVTAQAPGPPIAHKTVALSRFIERYDVRAAILREIGALLPHEFISEADLCDTTSGKDRARFRRCVDDNAAEFKPLRIRAKLDESDSEERWWWAKADDIAKAREVKDK